MFFIPMTFNTRVSQFAIYPDHVSKRDSSPCQCQNGTKIPPAKVLHDRNNQSLRSLLYKNLYHPMKTTIRVLREICHAVTSLLPLGYIVIASCIYHLIRKHSPALLESYRTYRGYKIHDNPNTWRWVLFQIQRLTYLRQLTMGPKGEVLVPPP